MNCTNFAERPALGQPERYDTARKTIAKLRVSSDWPGKFHDLLDLAGGASGRIAVQSRKATPHVLR
jgi:hypothetical protein